MSNRLHPGMEIRSINGKKVDGHLAATAAIRALEGEVVLTVARSGTMRDS